MHIVQVRIRLYSHHIPVSIHNTFMYITTETTQKSLALLYDRLCVWVLKLATSLRFLTQSMG